MKTRTGKPRKRSPNNVKAPIREPNKLAALEQTIRTQTKTKRKDPDEPNAYEWVNRRDALMFVLQINTGRRNGDIRIRTYGDFYEDKKGTWVVRKVMKPFYEQKTKRLVDFLSINKEMREELQDWYETVIKTGALGHDVTLEDYVFVSTHTDKLTGKHKLMTRQQARNRLAEAAKKAGIKNFGTHSLRKTHSLRFLEIYGFEHFQELQSSLGHSKPSQTMDYLGITSDILKNRMEGFSIREKDKVNR